MSPHEKPRRPGFRLMMPAPVAQLLWRVAAIVFIVLGVVGVVLPIVPTVPFLLAAAWAAGRGWPALEQWLLGHPRYGEPIRRWRSGGVVPRRAKWGATVMMFCSAVLLALTPAPLALKAGVPAVMAMVAIWLWRRPEN